MKRAGDMSSYDGSVEWGDWAQEDRMAMAMEQLTEQQRAAVREAGGLVAMGRLLLPLCARFCVWAHGAEVCSHSHASTVRLRSVYHLSVPPSLCPPV